MNDLIKENKMKACAKDALELDKDIQASLK